MQKQKQIKQAEGKIDSALLKDFQNEKEKIIEKNAAFEEMSPSEKRVAIAKDVLKWVAAGVFKPTQGLFVNKYVPVGTKDGEVIELVKTEGCSVCAKGALFMANLLERHEGKMEILKNENNKPYSYEDGHSRKVLCGIIEGEGKPDFWGRKNPMTAYFDTRQWNSIESYFEGYSGGQGTYIRDDKDRLVYIMENIIKNEGKFVMPRNL